MTARIYSLKKACGGYNASAEAIRGMVPRSHRMVTWASSSKEGGVCYAAADILSFNDYPGWYTASVPQIEQVWKNHTVWAEQHFPTKPFIASETGAGAIYEWKNNASVSSDGYVHKPHCCTSVCSLEDTVWGALPLLRGRAHHCAILMTRAQHPQVLPLSRCNASRQRHLKL